MCESKERNTTAPLLEQYMQSSLMANSERPSLKLAVAVGCIRTGTCGYGTDKTLQRLCLDTLRSSSIRLMADSESLGQEKYRGCC